MEMLAAVQNTLNNAQPSPATPDPNSYAARMLEFPTTSDGQVHEVWTLRPPLRPLVRTHNSDVTDEEIAKNVKDGDNPIITYPDTSDVSSSSDEW